MLQPLTEQTEHNDGGVHDETMDLVTGIGHLVGGFCCWAHPWNSSAQGDAGPRRGSRVCGHAGFSFSCDGFERTYWEFYRGFALIISLQLLLMMAFAWQASTISRHSRRLALPLAITLQLGCVGLAILGWMFFFGAPIVLSVVAVICSTVAVVLLAKNPDPREVL